MRLSKAWEMWFPRKTPNPAAKADSKKQNLIVAPKRCATRNLRHPRSNAASNFSTASLASNFVQLASTNPESAISFHSSVRYNVHLVTAQFIFPADIYKTSAGCGEARAKLPLC
jgi:hypothetical protein